MRMLRANKRNIVYGAVICLIGAFFYCYEFVLRIIPGVLQNELSHAFGDISATVFGELSAIYYFAYSPMQLPVGILMDRYGPRRLLTVACFCCAFGAWMFSVTSSLWIAGFGRFLTGFGSSFAFVGVLSLAISWFPRRYFSLLAGLITTLGMLSLVFGEIKITHLSSIIGWHKVLMLLVVIGFGLSLLLMFIVRDGPKGYASPLHSFQNFFLKTWQVITSFQIWLIGLAGACLYTSLSVFGELWGKSYLEKAHHLTGDEAAKVISALFFGWAVGAPIAGYLSDKSGRRILPLTIGAVVSLICISVVLYYPGLSYAWLMLLLFLYGAFSATEIIVFIMGKENSGTQLSGTVFAVVNMIVTLGGVLFQPLVGKLLDTFNDGGYINGTQVYTVSDYQIALSILPCSLLLVMILAFFMKDSRSKS